MRYVTASMIVPGNGWHRALGLTEERTARWAGGAVGETLRVVSARGHLPPRIASRALAQVGRRRSGCKR